MSRNTLRILAVFPLDVRRAETLGLIDKASDLVLTAREQGHHVDAVFADGRQLYTWRHETEHLQLPQEPLPRNSLRHKLYRSLGLFSAVTKLNLQAYDVLWVRAMPTFPQQIRLFRKAHKLGLRCILDVPTYPYHQESDSVLMSAVLQVSKLLDRRRAKYLDRVVLIADHAHLWGVPTLLVANGVRIRTQKATADRAAGKASDKLLVVGVAQWAPWHGLMRLFEAIVAAEVQQCFRFELAGVGPSSYALYAFAKQHALDVTWLGPVHGYQLNALLQSADVAVGTLCHAENQVLNWSPLKHRLYAAAGLPFIATFRDAVWDNCAAVYQVSSDSLPLDGSALLEFGLKARMMREHWGEDLRNRAEGLSWEVTYGEFWAYLGDGRV